MSKGGSVRARLNEFGRSLIVQRVLVQDRPVADVAAELGFSRQRTPLDRPIQGPRAGRAGGSFLPATPFSDED